MSLETSDVIESPVTEDATETAETTSPVETEDVASEVEQEEQAPETDAPDQEQETETEESDAAPELPKKQAKSYSPEVMDHYAGKFGLTAEDLKDPKWQNLVKSKIDSDIFIAEQNERLAALEGAEESETEETAETATATEATKPTPEQKAAYRETLGKYADRINDPDMVEAYGRAYCKSQGVNYDQAVKDGNFDAKQFVRDQSVYAISLVNSIAPDLFDAHLEAAIERRFSGFGRMYDDALHSNTWEDLRASDPNFKSLSAFGTPEFKSAYAKEVAANPWIEQILTDKSGKPLSRQEVIATRYQVVAKLLAGQKPSSQMIQDAINKGKQDATKAKTRASTSRVTGGAGRPTTGTFTSTKEKPEGGSLQDAWKNVHSGVI